MGADFIGKTVVVTGAAQGIGLAIARRFLAAAAQVVVVDINPPSAEGFIFQPADVSDENDVRSFVARTVEQCGGIDILINNAGVAVENTIEHTTVEEWERVMAVNVRGVFLCVKHIIPMMRKRGGGVIVNIGSIEAMGANPAHAAYAASKGAVHSLTRNIALECGGDKIRCNAIAPGWIETPFNENLINQFAEPDKARAAIRDMHPLGRVGTAEDIAAAAWWLAGDDAAFANGQIYVMDGGRTACLPLPPL